jgi:hypothetical protein
MPKSSTTRPTNQRLGEVYAPASPGTWSAITTGTAWGAAVAPGNWVVAPSQMHNASVAPNGGANMTATPRQPR